MSLTSTKNALQPNDLANAHYDNSVTVSTTTEHQKENNYILHTEQLL